MRSEFRAVPVQADALAPHALSASHRRGELGGMRSHRHPRHPCRAALARSVAWLCAALVVASWAAGAVAADAASFDELAARARRAGLRVVAGERLVLVTDRPPREGDGIDDLPAIFTQAFLVWCGHFGLEPGRLAAWRAFGCLITDHERFRAAGLLPDTVPEFANGYCDRDRFWLADQSNPAYRRHLLLHEGVHAFTITVRDLATPAWYAEGIAEHLATHRLETDAGGAPRFVPTPVPVRAADVEQLGRIETLRGLRARRAAPSFDDVLALPAGRHRDLAAYASSWAAVTMLAQHPAHAASFARLERGPLARDLNDRLAASPGWDAVRVARDFDAFTQDVDYGYDLARMAIDWSPGRPLTARARADVQADLGWQNTGVAVAAGRGYAVEATGRCRVGTLVDGATDAETVLESTADGISLRWYRGRPVGRLMVAQWRDDVADGDRPGFEVVAEGAAVTFTARHDGPLYVRINEAPGERADNEGSLALDIAPR